MAGKQGAVLKSPVQIWLLFGEKKGVPQPGAAAQKCVSPVYSWTPFESIGRGYPPPMIFDVVQIPSGRSTGRPGKFEVVEQLHAD